MIKEKNSQKSTGMQDILGKIRK